MGRLGWQDPDRHNPGIQQHELAENKIVKFPERNSIEPVKMVAIPLFEGSLWCGGGTELPELDNSDCFSKSILVPADHIENLNETLAFPVKGDSMEPLISEGDVLLMDSSEKACYTQSMGKIIVAYLDGEFNVKWLKMINNEMCLVPENYPSYPIQPIKAGCRFKVCGVVIGRHKFEPIDEICRKKI